jgi:hypothetical protein
LAREEMLIDNKAVITRILSRVIGLSV